MKKNRMMRLASGLLVAVLVTTSMISGTFAKYTTQDSAKDEARVAKWGVELQVVGDLYGESYKDAVVADTDATLTVQAKDYATMNLDPVAGTKEDNVVAPGTKNENGFSFSLNGTPEVDGKVVATVEYENIYLSAGTYGVMVAVPVNTVTEENFAQLGTLYVLNGAKYVVADGATYSQYYTFEDSVTLADSYYPVEYGMSGTLSNYNEDYNAAFVTTNTLENVVKAFGDNFDTIVAADSTNNSSSNVVLDGKTTKTWTMKFDSNKDLNTELFKIGNQTIKWKWDFCQQTTCPDGDGACNYCKADTVLGNLMAGDSEVKVVKAVDGGYATPVAATGEEAKDYNLETSFSIDITVTQVD